MQSTRNPHGLGPAARRAFKEARRLSLRRQHLTPTEAMDLASTIPLRRLDAVMREAGRRASGAAEGEPTTGWVEANNLHAVARALRLRADARDVLACRRGPCTPVEVSPVAA